MSIRNYRDLLVWQKAMDLAETIYRATARFPKEETYGLRAQLRDSAVSIPSNIAEGYGRGSDRELRRFLFIARGSLGEAETQVLLAERFCYLSDQTARQILGASAEEGRLINGLANKLSCD